MKAWQLLDSREKWCRGDYGRNKHGISVEPTSPEACAWCGYGAILKCYGSRSSELYYVHDKVRNQIGGLLSLWNDEHTYEEVHALLKELDI